MMLMLLGRNKGGPGDEAAGVLNEGWQGGRIMKCALAQSSKVLGIVGWLYDVLAMAAVTRQQGSLGQGL